MTRPDADRVVLYLSSVLRACLHAPFSTEHNLLSLEIQITFAKPTPLPSQSSVRVRGKQRRKQWHEHVSDGTLKRIRKTIHENFLQKKIPLTLSLINEVLVETFSGDVYLFRPIATLRKVMRPNDLHDHQAHAGTPGTGHVSGSLACSVYLTAFSKLSKKADKSSASRRRSCGRRKK
jgi:hypothetical protein